MMLSKAYKSHKSAKQWTKKRNITWSRGSVWPCARIIHVNPEVQDFIARWSEVVLLYLDQNGHTFNHPSVFKHPESWSCWWNQPPSSAQMKWPPEVQANSHAVSSKYPNGSRPFSWLSCRHQTWNWNIPLKSWESCPKTASQPLPWRVVPFPGWQTHAVLHQASECRWSEPVMSGNSRVTGTNIDKKNLSSWVPCFPFQILSLIWSTLSHINHKSS